MPLCYVISKLIIQTQKNLLEIYIPSGKPIGTYLMQKNFPF